MAYVIGDNCIACGTCMSVCPVDAISEGDIYKIDPDTCISCGSYSHRFVLMMQSLRANSPKNVNESKVALNF